MATDLKQVFKFQQTDYFGLKYYQPNIKYQSPSVLKKPNPPHSKNAFRPLYLDETISKLKKSPVP